MSMPKISDINPVINIVRDDAVNILMTSIAMEELALAHILNAEGEKIQYVLGTLENRDPGEITICDIMAVNSSVQKTLRDVIKAEMMLQFKLESAIELAEQSEDCELTIRGQKIWRDANNHKGLRPATTEVTLFQDGEVYRSVTVDSTGDGLYVFACLPVWRDSDTRYVYTVDELTVPTGYIKTINGYNIINTIEPGSITIVGTKVWVDEPPSSDRPNEVTVHLHQNGTLLTSTQVNSPTPPESTATFNFDNVPEFDGEGKLFAYSFREDDVPNYEAEIVDFTITNSHI